MDFNGLLINDLSLGYFGQGDIYFFSLPYSTDCVCLKKITNLQPVWTTKH